MKQELTSYYPRNLMASVIFAWLFVILVYFFSCNSLLSQMQQPVFISPLSDNTYWFLHILNIPQWLLGHYIVALAFDIILTCSCLICIFVPHQRLFTLITIIGIWLLFICYCTAAGKHYAQIGYLLIPLPFLILTDLKFSLLWNGVRYWICFLYTCAGLYKIYYGGFANPTAMTNILQQMNGEWLFFKPSGLQANAILYLLKHPDLSQWLYRSAALIELSLVIGFFTKKLDKYLIVLLLIFHLGNLFLLHISFVEQSLIFAAFCPWKKWATYFHSTTINDRPLTV